MTSESQTAPESASGLAGASSRPLLADGRRWRLPIAYGSIASVALGVDLALILGCATFAETVYHRIPNEIAGEYSHTLAAAIFVAILFVAAMRVQKLYSSTRRCAPVLGGRRGSASRAPGGVEICAAARTGKRGAEGAHNRQRCVRAERAAALHRELDPSRLSRRSQLPHIRWRSGRRGRHREHHFALPHVRYSRGHAVRRSRAHVERAVDCAAAQSAALACDAGSLRNACALVSAHALRHWRYCRSACAE